MRNILVHEYDSVDVDIVWEVIENDLLEVKRRIRALLQEVRQQPRVS